MDRTTLEAPTRSVERYHITDRSAGGEARQGIEKLNFFAALVGGSSDPRNSQTLGKSIGLNQR